MKKKPTTAEEQVRRQSLRRDDKTRGNMIAQGANRKRQQKQMHKQSGKK